MIQNVSEETTVRRKTLPEYESNPSRGLVSQSSKIGTRRVNKAGDKMMVVSDDGVCVGAARFHEIEEVDRSKFVKLYVGGVTAFESLSAPGAKVFRMVYNFILDNPNTDTIPLHHKTARTLGKSTFERGLTELLSKEIIYKSTHPNLFFLNIDYMFNGDRLAMVKEYRMKAEPDKPRDFIQEPLPL